MTMKWFSKNLDVKYWYYNTTTKRHGLPEPEEWDIFFDHHSLYLDDDYSRMMQERGEIGNGTGHGQRPMV